MQGCRLDDEEKEDAQEIPETHGLIEVVANATNLDDILFIIDIA